jgi:hypothetical protein
MSTRPESGLGLELIELAHALDSVRIVADLDRTRSFASPRDVREAVRAVSATINLIAARLRHLGSDLAEAGPRSRHAPAPAPAPTSRRARNGVP